MWFVQRKQKSEDGGGTRGPHKGQGDSEEETETLVMGGREGGEMVGVVELGSKCSQAGRRGEAHSSQEGAELGTDLGSTQVDALQAQGQALLGCSTVKAEPEEGVMERDAIPTEWLWKKKEVKIPPLRHTTGERRKRSKAKTGRAFTAPLRPLETLHSRAGGKELLKEDRLKMPQGESELTKQGPRGSQRRWKQVQNSASKRCFFSLKLERRKVG